MNKIISLLIIIFLFVNGCCKVKYYVIPEKDKFQVNLGDTMIYKTPSGIADTLFINYKDEGIVPDNINTTDDCSDNDWHEKIYIKYMLLKNNQETEHLFIGQSIAYKKLDFLINYGRITGANHNYTKHKKMMLNNTEYKNVLEFNLNGDLTKVFLNTQYGVLEYKYKTGEEFYLDEYINSDL